MQIFIIGFCLVLLGVDVQSQTFLESASADLNIDHRTAPPATQDGLAGTKNIYFELLGSGGLYSINYEQFVTNGVSLRGGISYFSIGDKNSVLTVPVTLHHLRYLKNDSFFDLNIGMTFMSADDKKYSFIVLGLGFREQPISKNLFTRFTFNPFLKLTETKRIGVTIGMSIGYTY